MAARAAAKERQPMSKQKDKGTLQDLATKQQI
jgi:hypothetical protein